MNTEFLIAGVVWYVVFLLSTTCHEAAHAWAAQLGGDLTAFHGGQVSLDPIPHIRREPFGMVIFPLLTYATGGWMMGWASAPFDPHWSERYPRRAAWMSLAGPGANFTLAILAGILIHIGIWTGFFRSPGIGRLHARGGAGGRGCRVGSGDVREPAVLAQPAVGHVQSDPGAAARWLRRSRVAGLRRHGAPHPEFRPLAGRLQHDRPAAGVAGVRPHVPARLLLRPACALPRPGIRH